MTTEQILNEFSEVWDYIWRLGNWFTYPHIHLFEIYVILRGYFILAKKEKKFCPKEKENNMIIRYNYPRTGQSKGILFPQ